MENLRNIDNQVAEDITEHLNRFVTNYKNNGVCNNSTNFRYKN